MREGRGSSAAFPAGGQQHIVFFCNLWFLFTLPFHSLMHKRAISTNQECAGAADGTLRYNYTFSSAMLPTWYQLVIYLLKNVRNTITNKTFLHAYTYPSSASSVGSAYYASPSSATHAIHSLSQPLTLKSPLDQTSPSSGTYSKNGTLQCTSFH